MQFDNSKGLLSGDYLVASVKSPEGTWYESTMQPDDWCSFEGRAIINTGVAMADDLEMEAEVMWSSAQFNTWPVFFGAISADATAAGFSVRL